uniref:Uncharacterized protein n=1 Tax=Ciona intestinalis TaxID=7719 RepID=H2XR94_CIOIN
KQAHPAIVKKRKVWQPRKLFLRENRKVESEVRTKGEAVLGVSL